MRPFYTKLYISIIRTLKLTLNITDRPDVIHIKAKLHPIKLQIHPSFGKMAVIIKMINVIFVTLTKQFWYCVVVIADLR